MRTRAQRRAGVRAGLFAALYLFTAVMPAGAAAADPTPSASSEGSAAPVEASASLAPIVPSPVPLQPPSVAATPTPAASRTPAVADIAVPPVPYIVTFSRGSTPAQRAAALSKGGAWAVTTIPVLNLALVELPRDSAAAGASAMRASAGVERVEIDRDRAVDATPGDPRYDEQWSLRKIGWDRVNDAGPPTGEALVAILDTGVDAIHPDLEGRLVPGASFVDGAAPNTDVHGHGTWLAGIVAAATDNDEGIAGIGGSGVRVLPITVLGRDGTGRDSDVIQGIVHATDAGADVILMAFSSPGFSAALQAAVDYAWDSGAIIVAANGNDGTTTATYPAGDRGVIGVSSTDRHDALAQDSNSGPQTFMAAPGVEILTTSRHDEYSTVSGTSAAAAAVAAAAAILRSADDEISNGVIVGRLARSAAPAGTQAETGNGRLDLARALADLGIAELQPAGVEGVADGGPFVGPYEAALGCNSTGNGNWNATGTWSCGRVPTGADTVVILDAHTVTVTATTSTTDVPTALTLNAGGTLVINANFQLTIAGNIVVNGTFVNSSTAVINRTAGTWSVNSGGIYQHNADSNTIPAGTYAAGSLIRVTGAATNTSTAAPRLPASGISGNVEWNSPSQSVAVIMNGAASGGTMTIGGNLDIVSTGTGSISGGGSTPRHLTVNGNVTVAGGTFNAVGGDGAASATNTTITYTFGGNLTVNGGTFRMIFYENNNSRQGALSVGGNLTVSSGTMALVQNISTAGNTTTMSVTGTTSLTGGTLHLSNGSDRAVTATLNGNVSIAGGTLTRSGSNAATLRFGGSSTQTYSKTSGTISGALDFAILSGATVDFGTSLLDGSSGTFNLDSGGAIRIGHASGITGLGASGQIQVTGTRAFSTGASYTYNGTNGQATGNGLPATVANLTVAKPSGTLTLGSSVNVTSDLTISGGAFDLGNFTANRSAAGGTLSLSNGATLRIGGSGTLPSNYSTHSIGMTSTVEYAGTTTAVAALNSSQRYGHLVVSGSGVGSTADFAVATSLTVSSSAVFAPTGGTATMNDGSSITNSGTLTFRGLTIAASAAVSATGDLAVDATFTVSTGATFTPAAAEVISGSGTLTGSGTVKVTRTAVTAGFSNQYTITNKTLTGLTVEYTGAAAQVVSALTYGHLTMNNSNGATLAGDATVNGTLTLSSGNVTTAAATLIVSSTGTVSRTAGHIVGNLRRHIATGSPTVAFQIGDASRYTPVSITFASVTTAGTLTISTTAGDHPDIASSAFIVSKTVNRYWTLTNAGIVFTTYGATFDFVAGDVDAGATTAAFDIGRRASSTWRYESVTSTTATSTTGNAIAGFGDIQIGEAQIEPPLLTASSGTTAHTENVAVVVDAGIAVADADSANLASGTVTVGTGYTAGQDVLAFTTQSGITGSWSAPTLTLTGSATLANWQTAFRSVTYNNTSNAPNTGARTIEFVVDDGGVSSNTASKTVSITAVNDGPENSVPGGQATNKDTPRVFSTANGNLISIADPDAGTASVQVQLTATNGTITLSGTTGLTFSVGDGTADATMTFTGTIAAIDTALDGLSFTPTSGFTGSASLEIVTNDQGNTGSGGALSDTDSVPITISTGAAVIEFRGSTPTGSSSGNGTGGTSLSLSNTTGAVNGDLLIAAITTRNTAVTTLAGWTPIRDVVSSGSLIRTWYYWKIASNEPSTWTWTIASSKASGVVLAFSGVDTTNPFVNESSQNNATSLNVTAPERIPGITGTFVVYAGSAANGQAWDAAPTSFTWSAWGYSTGASTGTRTTTSMAYRSMGTQTTTTGALTGTLVAADAENTGWSVTLRRAVLTAAPVLTASGGTTAHTENVAVAVDAGITVSDSDSTSLASGTVTIGSGYTAGQDVLAFTNQNGITGSWSAPTLTLTGSASLANWQTALRSVTYNNTSDAPNTGNRTIEFVVNDGSANSNTANKTVSVSTVNDAPVNSVPGTQTTTTNTAKVFSSANGNLISISDDATSGSQQVQLTGTNGTITLSATTGLTFSVGDGTADATMTFTGTVAAVNTALAGLSFAPTTGFTGTATLQIVTNDQGNTGSGGALSDTDSVSITVTQPSLGVFTANQDVGSVGFTGSANHSGDTYTVKGGGADIGGGTVDAFHFLHKPLVGSGRITARVTSVENTNFRAKAGVMMREALTAGSQHAFVPLNASSEINFEWRRPVDSVSQENAWATFSTPYWVRLTRNGNAFTAERSPDGVTWTQVGTTQTIGMTAAIHVGLAVTPRDNTKLNTSTFDNVSVEVYSDLGIFSAYQDVGASGGHSSYGTPASSYHVVGAGTGIGSTSDQFQFVHRTMTGDGRLTANVASLWNSDASTYGFGGVMLRDSLATNSQFMMARQNESGSNTAAQVYRTTAGGSSTTTTTAATIPEWVRVTRTGSSFTTERSADGITWAAVGTTQTITMGATIYVGLAVSSLQAGKFADAVFNNVSLQLASEATADFITPNEGSTVLQSSTSAAIQWTEIGFVTSRSLQRQSGTPSAAGSCTGTTWSNDGSAVTTVSPVVQTGLLTATCYRWLQTVGASSEISGSVLIDTTAPSAPSVSATNTSSVYQAAPNGTVYFRPAAASTMTLSATGTDSESAIGKQAYGLTTATGWSPTYAQSSGDGASAMWSFASSGVSTTIPVNSINNAIGIGYTTKVPSVTTSINGASSEVTVSPDGKFALFGSATSPYIQAYRWTGTALGERLPSPSTLPTATVWDIEFSPDGAYVAVANNGTPNLIVYSWSASGFGAAVSGPASPLGGAGYGVSFSPDGSTITMSSNTSPYVAAWPWNGAFGTRYANPASLPSGIGNGVEFSPDGAYIAMALEVTPFIQAWAWSNGFGAKLTAPATLPVGAGYDLEFSRDGRAIAVATQSSPYLAVYPWNAGFGTKFANPATLPAGAGWSVAFDPLSQYVAFGHASAPFVSVYPWSPNGFGTKLANPVANPGGTANDVDFSPRGAILVGASVASTASAVAYQEETTSTATTITLTADSAAPTGNVTFSAPAANSGQSATTTSVAWSGGTDAGSGVAAAQSVQRQSGTVVTTGTCSDVTWANDGSAVSSASPLAVSGLATNTCYRWQIMTTDYVGNVSSTAAISSSILVDTTAPTTTFTVPAAGTTVQSETSVSVTWSETETGSGLASRSMQRQKGSVVTAGTCVGVTYANDGVGDTGISPRSNTGLTVGQCYRWIQALTDNVNNSSATTSGEVLISTSVFAAADAYTVRADTVLAVAAPGVLANDTGGSLTVGTPRPVSGPASGVLVLNADGSFSYTPTPGFSGTDSFTYKANNGTTDSAAATVTITVRDGAYVPGSSWPAAFDSTRYLKLTFPAYVPAGSVVTGATFRHKYRSATPSDTTCYYFEVYSGVTLLATHGSAASPVSCNETTSYASDAVALPEVDTVAEANTVTIKMFIRNSGGGSSQHRLATLGVVSSLD